MSVIIIEKFGNAVFTIFFSSDGTRDDDLCSVNCYCTAFNFRAEFHPLSL